MAPRTKRPTRGNWAATQESAHGRRSGKPRNTPCLRLIGPLEPTVVDDFDGLQNESQTRQIREIDRHIAAVRVHQNPTNPHLLASLRFRRAISERSRQIAPQSGRRAPRGERHEANERRVEQLRLVLAAVVCIKSARLDVAFAIAGLRVREFPKRNAVADPEKRTALRAALLRRGSTALRASRAFRLLSDGRDVFAVAQIEETGLCVAVGVADAVAETLISAYRSFR